MFQALNIRIINKHHKNGYLGEYIGRGSPLGNPWTHLEGTKTRQIVPTREEAIARFRKWIEERIEDQDPKILRELHRLYDIAVSKGSLHLQCYCYPKPCHGEVIRDILNRAHFHNEEN